MNEEELRNSIVAIILTGVERHMDDCVTDEARTRVLLEEATHAAHCSEQIIQCIIEYLQTARQGEMN